MRFLYVGPVPPLVGGIAQHGAQMVSALRAAGHHVSVRSWASQYPRALYKGPQRDPPAVPLSEAVFTLRWWSPLSWWRAGLAAKHFDVILFPWVTPIQAVAYRVLLSAARGVRSIALVHNVMPHERRLGDVTLTRWVLGRVRGAVVHARSAIDDLKELSVDVPIVYVPMPALLKVTETSLPSGPPYHLLFFGLVRPYKGVDVAIKALALLRARGVQVTLTVAGQFWTPEEELRGLARDEGVAEHCAIRPGYVSDAETGHLLARHHLVIAPYRSATQSAILPLAFAAGRPAVATNLPGLKEQVIEGINGVLAPPDDAAGLASAVELALGKLPALAEGARAHRTSWADVAAAVLEASG